MERPSPNYKWWVVFMLWFVCFFNYADRQAIFAVFPKLKEEFGFTKTQLGLIGSAFMWVYAAGAPFAGFAGDRFRRKNIILGGCVFWSLITVLTSWCGKLSHFVTIRALEGFGETFYFPSSMALISDYHESGTRSRALSFHQSSVYIGTILGSWMGAFMAERFGWRSGFYIFGTAGLVLAAGLFRFLREPIRGEAEKSSLASPLKKASILEVLGLILKCPPVLILMLGFVGANFVATIFLTWTPTFLIEKFHFRLAGAGLTGTVFIHLASALSVPIGGILADRVSLHVRGGRILVQAIGLLIGAYFVFLVGHTREVGTLLAAMTAFGLCKGVYDSNIFAAVFDFVPANCRSTAAGLMNTIGWGGGALGPLLTGWFAEHGSRGSEVENMSAAISFGGAIYGTVALLFLGLFYFLNKKPGVKAPD